MTIDERLEALTQSLELLTHDVHGLQGYVKEIAESTARLLHIAQIHEHRITRLEGGA